MSLIKRHGTIKHQYGQNETVLVLTDGSKRAERVAEWGLIFAETTRAAIHRIDVVDCLDSGVIIHQYEERIQDEREHERGQPSRQLMHETIDREETQNREHEPAVDVLHGVPHETILDYTAANAIDVIIIGVGERTRLTQSFIGIAFANVSRAATIPVVTLEGEV